MSTVSSVSPISPELAHYLSVLWRRRRVALTAAAVTFVACLLVVAVRGRTLTVSSSILVTTFDRSGIAPLPVAGGAAPSGVLAALSGPKVDPIRAFLASRTLRVRVARRMDPSLDAESKGDPLKSLGYKIETSDGAGGALVISVSARRKPAESIAQVNAYVLEELEALLSESAVTDTKRQRLFTEKLLGENATRRREIEESLMGFSPDGTIELDPKMAALLSRASHLRERAASRQVEARALGVNAPTSTIASADTNTATDAASPNKLLEEAAKLQAEARQHTTQTGPGVVVPLARVPLLALEYRRLQGELAILDELNAVLRTQREMALIQEVTDAPSYAILDPASRSAAAATPRIRHIAMIGLLSSCLTALGAALVRDRS